MANVKINVEVIQRAALASLRKLQDQAKKTQNSFAKITSGLKKVGSALVKVGVASAAIGFAAVTFALAKFASGSVSAASKIEDLTIRFKTLTGSTAEANKTIKDLQEFAASTPFQLVGLAETTAKLIGFGLSSEEAKDKLQILGDVAAASGTDIQEIGLIFGQITAAGKLTGERLLQLQERAIPIGPAIAKTMGIAESAVKQAVTNGEVDLKTFEAAFDSLNDKGQFAFEGMEQASRTLSGRISTLKDNFALLQNDVGQRLLPAFKAVTTAFTSLIQSIQKSDVFNQLLIDIGNNIPNAIGLAVKGLIFFNEAFQNTRIFINEISLLFDQFIGTIVEVSISVIKSANAIREFFGQKPKTETLEFLELLSEAVADNAFETEKANERIRKSRDEVSKFISESGNLVIETYNSEKQAVEAEAETTVQANEKKKKAVQDFFTLRQALVASQKELEAEEKEASSLLEQERGNAQLERLVTAFGEQEAARIAFQANELVQNKKFEEAKILLKKKGLEADKQIKAQEDANEKTRIQNLRGSLGRISTLTSSNNKTLFRIGKAAAISQAGIDGFAAVQKALASAPPPFNFVLAALVGAATAANVANIASQKPPSFQDGGIVPGNSFSGDNVAANVNSGEVILNREQQAQTLFAISNGAGGSGENVTNVTVELDGEVVGRAVSRQVRDGLELGEIA